jgi:hypothetical protein
MLLQMREMKGAVIEACTREGEQLIGVAARHLIAYYRSVDLHFSLAPALTDASREARRLRLPSPESLPSSSDLSYILRSHALCTIAP